MVEASRPAARVRLSFESRCRVVRFVLEGVPAAVVAARCGVHRSTVYRLRDRYRAGGWAALVDQPPVPHSQPRRTPGSVEQHVIDVRRATWFGPVRLAGLVGIPPSTIGKILRRHGLSRRPHPQTERYPRYERDTPGDLLHIDVKRLGRFFQVGKAILRDGIQRSPGAGWHYLHVCIDDHTRLAYCEINPGQGKTASAAFLQRAITHFNDHGITCRQVMTDNGHAYKSRLWADTCRSLHLEHLRTRPYTPRTNGKAERFIQTALREWCYRYPYPTSTHRTQALPGWIRWYNRRRPHGSLHGHPPISRVAHLRGHYT